MGTTVLTQAINGMGGVGKTSLAAAVAHRLRSGLDVAWWVRAETELTLVEDLRDLAVAVGLPTVGDPAEVAGAARVWLEQQSGRRWLVVFDNAPDQHALSGWLPASGTGLVLVTSRSRVFDQIGDVIDLATFPDTVAEAFLRARLTSSARGPHQAAGEDPAGVLARLQGLPLALEQAAAWVLRSPTQTLAGYCELFDNAARADPFPAGTRPVGYDATATTTWRVSIDAAENETVGAARVMAVLAHFAPEPIPTAWLTDTTNSYLSGVDIEGPIPTFTTNARARRPLEPGSWALAKSAK